MSLNQIAWTMVDDKSPLKTRDYATAVYIAERAVRASKNADPNILDTLGTALFKAGKVDRAIEVQQKAVDMLDAAGDKVTDANKTELRARLEEFKNARR